MKVFVDTLYWIAIANPRDSWKISAQQARACLSNAALVTTDEVLSEFLTALAGGGVHLRRQAAAIAHAILADENVTILPQNHPSFLAALSLYENRADKEYSLTD